MGVGRSVEPVKMSSQEVDESLLKKLSKAVQSKDIPKLELLLRQASVLERETALNPTFLKQTSVRRYRHTKECLLQDPPLLFQALLRGEEIFKNLLKAGANLYVSDQQGWNIVHFLVTVSYCVPDMEGQCLETYDQLKVGLQQEDLNILLKMEDFEGLRPLEFAIHLGCVQMFDAIFNTEGLYLVRKDIRGFFCVKEYDITEYESLRCDNRRHKSPLLLLTSVDRKILRDQRSVDILTKGAVRTWTNAKLVCNAPFIVLWGALRLICMLCFYFILGVHITPEGLEYVSGSTLEGYENHLLDLASESNSDDGNISNSHDNETCEIVDWYGAYDHPRLFVFGIAYLCIYCTFSILSDLFDGFVSIFHNWARWRNCFGKSKTLITSASFYRICQLVFSLFAMIWVLCYLLAPGAFIVSLGLILVTWCSTWAVLYFIQILPYAGHFVNSIQEMLLVMAQFVFVYAIILIPFPHTFQVLLRESDLCRTVSGFDSFPLGIYSVFRIMLNMIDLTTYQSPSVNAAYILHILYVFFVAILLVNFLIALMSASVGEVVNASEAIMLIQRLSVVMLVEWRLKYPFSCVYLILHKFLYNTQKGKITMTHVEKVTRIK